MSHAKLKGGARRALPSRKARLRPPGQRAGKPAGGETQWRRLRGTGHELIEQHGRQVEKADTFRAWTRYLRNSGPESEALDVLDRTAKLSASAPFQGRG